MPTPYDENLSLCPPSQGNLTMSGTETDILHLQRTVSKVSSIQSLKHKLSTASLFRRASAMPGQPSTPQQQPVIPLQVLVDVMNKKSDNEEGCSSSGQCMRCIAPCICDVLQGTLSITTLDSERHDRGGRAEFENTINEALMAPKGQQGVTDEQCDDEQDLDENTMTIASEAGIVEEASMADENSLGAPFFQRRMSMASKREPTLSMSSICVTGSFTSPPNCPATMSFPSRTPSIASIATVRSQASSVSTSTSQTSTNNPHTTRPGFYSRTPSASSSIFTGSTLSLTSSSYRSTGSGSTVTSRPGTPMSNERERELSRFEREYVSFPEYTSNPGSYSPTLENMGKLVGALGRKFSRKRKEEEEKMEQRSEVRPVASQPNLVCMFSGKQEMRKGKRRTRFAPSAELKVANEGETREEE